MTIELDRGHDTPIFGPGGHEHLLRELGEAGQIARAFGRPVSRATSRKRPPGRRILAVAQRKRAARA